MSDNNSSFRDEPSYWFVVLEIAQQRNEAEKAAEAKRELRRLGVCVCSYHPRAKEDDDAST